jgi:prepilin-type processing-associated H-X9-DG protein
MFAHGNASLTGPDYKNFCFLDGHIGVFFQK